MHFEKDYIYLSDNFGSHCIFVINNPLFLHGFRVSNGQCVSFVYTLRNNPLNVRMRI